jgi:hypothetical protein
VCICPAGVQHGGTEGELRLQPGVWLPTLSLQGTKLSALGAKLWSSSAVMVMISAAEQNLHLNLVLSAFSCMPRTLAAQLHLNGCKERMSAVVCCVIALQMQVFWCGVVNDVWCMIMGVVAELGTQQAFHLSCCFGCNTVGLFATRVVQVYLQHAVLSVPMGFVLPVVTQINSKAFVTPCRSSHQSGNQKVLVHTCMCPARQGMGVKGTAPQPRLGHFSAAITTLQFPTGARPRINQSSTTKHTPTRTKPLLVSNSPPSNTHV